MNSYHTLSPENLLNNKAYLVCVFVDAIIAVALTFISIKFQESQVRKKMSKLLFTSSKQTNIGVIYAYLEGTSYMNENEKFISIMNILYAHNTSCKNENCTCNSIIKKFIQYKGEKKISKVVNTFKTLCEKFITDVITNRAFGKAHLLQKVLLIHSDFLFSVKKKYNLSLYYSQYYLMKKGFLISYYYRYAVYEICARSYEELYKNQDVKENAYFLDETFNEDKIRKLINNLCDEIDRLRFFKGLKNSNAKFPYRCEDIIHPLIDFAKNKKILVKLISEYNITGLQGEGRRFFSREIKFLIYYADLLFDFNMKARFSKSHKGSSFLNIKQTFEADSSKLLNTVLPGMEDKFPVMDDIDNDNSFLTSITKNMNYLITFMDNENNFIIDYVSIDLCEKLAYTRNEVINKNFNDFFLPKSISNFHALYMKQFVLMGYRTYQKTSFLLNKETKLYPFDIEMKVLPTLSTIYSLITSFKTIEDINYNLYYVMCDTEFNFSCISETFENQFLFNLKMLNSLKINLLDFFGVNKDNVSIYFKNEQRKSAPTQPAVSEFKKKMILLSKTTIKPEELTFYDLIYPMEFTREKLSKIEVVGKEKILGSILKLCRNVEEIGLEKEWKWKLNDLYNKFKYKFSTDDLLPELIAGKCYGLKIKCENKFFIKFIYKRLGNFSFYIVRISDNKEDYIKTKNGKKKINLSTETSTRQLPQASLFDLNIHQNPLSPVQNLYTANPRGETMNSEMSFGNVSSNNVNEISRISNNTSSFKLKESSTEMLFNNVSGLGGSLFSATPKTKELLVSKKMRQSQKRSINLFYDNKKGDTLAKQRVEMALKRRINTRKVKTKINFLKLALFTTFTLLFGLNLITLLVNSSMKKFSENLFVVKANSFLLANDVFFGSLSAVVACMISDGIQSIDLMSIDKKIDQSAEELISHYYSLQSSVNVMIGKKEMRTIFDVLTNEETYTDLLDNWKTSNGNSSLIEEVYSMHFSLRQFSLVSDDSKCRIREYFYENAFEKKEPSGADDLSTKEEKFVYFIFNNVITKISRQLEDLTKQTNTILHHDNKKSKRTFLVLNIIILTFSLILFFIIIATFVYCEKIFSYQMLELFDKKEKEDVFFEDVLIYRKMLKLFTISTTLEYVNFKRLFSLKSRSIPNKNMISLPTMKSKPNSKVRKAKDTSTPVSVSPVINQEFYKKISLRIFLYSNLSIVASFLIVIGIEIASVFVGLNSYDGLIIENEIATNFLQRVPKLYEITLYSLSSVIADDLFKIKVEQSDYTKNILSNYYKVSVNLAENSYFKDLGNSNYGYVYYQLSILRQNIHLFINDDTMKSYLSTTKENEFLFNQDELFCIYSIMAYLKTLKEYSAQEFFETLSSEVTECRSIGNGINLSGYKVVIDLFLQQLTNTYFNFINAKTGSEKINTFLEDKNIRVIEENLLNVIQILHLADAATIQDDIQNSYSNSHIVNLVFSLVIICFYCLVILILVVLILKLFDFYNSVICNIVNSFNASLKKYN